MKKDRIVRFVDGAIGMATEAWNDASRDFVIGIEINARAEERDNNIAIAALAMMDGGLSPEQTLSMLQKHWDLRRSEALPFITWAKRQITSIGVRPDKNQKKK